MASSDLTELQTPPLNAPEPELESGVAQDGNWEVELRHWRRLFGNARGFTACFCPFITLAQISARLFSERAFWWVVTVNFVNLALIPLWAVFAIKTIVEGERLYLVALYVVEMVLFVHDANVNAATLRGKAHARFQIPGTPNEDKLKALCCFPCVVAQMATQVKSLSKPDALPAYDRQFGASSRGPVQYSIIFQ